MKPDYEAEKRLAAEKSLDFVKDGMKLGLGSGSTANYMLEYLAQRVRQGLRIRGVPTSERTRRLAQRLEIPLATLDEIPHLDLTIDGTDQFDPNLNLIKGGGGALLREKVVASVSDRMIVIADSRKQVDRLGSFPVPVEVAKFAATPVAEQIAALGPTPILRSSDRGQPFVTDEGHYILDCDFRDIPDPPKLAAKLDTIPGIMEHGLFINLANTVILAQNQCITILQ